jgi:hypothetical protein
MSAFVIIVLVTMGGSPQAARTQHNIESFIIRPGIG